MAQRPNQAYVSASDEPPLPPPRSERGIVHWMRENLFSSIPNTVLTLLGIAFLVWAIPPIIRWTFIDAVWFGDGREACLEGTGAC